MNFYIIVNSIFKLLFINDIIILFTFIEKFLFKNVIGKDNLDNFRQNVTFSRPIQNDVMFISSS